MRRACDGVLQWPRRVSRRWRPRSVSCPRNCLWTSRLIRSPSHAAFGLLGLTRARLSDTQVGQGEGQIDLSLFGFRLTPFSHSQEVGEDGERKRAAEFSIEQIAAKRARIEDPTAEEAEARRPVFVKPGASIGVRAPPTPILPAGWRMHHDDSNKPYYENLESGEVTWDCPAAPVEVPVAPKATAPPPVDVNAIIAQVQKDAEEAAAKEAARIKEEERAAKDAARRRAGGGGTPSGSSKGSKADAAAKEKKLMGLFSTIVVQVMSKYREHLEAEQFKKRAREVRNDLFPRSTSAALTPLVSPQVTVLLCEKEKKHPLYASETYDSLSTEKAAKVKAFTKDWVKKLIDRKRAVVSNGAPGSGAVTPSLTTPSPQTPSAAPSANYASSPVFGASTDGPSSTTSTDHGFFPQHFRLDQQFQHGNGTPLSRPPMNGFNSTNGNGVHESPSLDPRRPSNGSRVGEVMAGMGSNGSPVPSPGLYGRELPRETNGGRW